jgi:two-component system NtrC family sensor kinase
MPNLEGISSDMFEIPFFISLLYLKNPFYLFIVSVFGSFATPNDGSYYSTLLFHFGAYFVSWYAIRFMLKKSLRAIHHGILISVYVVFHYFVLLLPLLILTNYIFGINSDKTFIDFYLHITYLLRFEVFSVALIFGLYVAQLKYSQTLKAHLLNLEVIVSERTKELEGTLNELKNTQQQLIQSEKMASLGTLLSGIAHEINNPLNFISGGLHIVSDTIAELKKVENQEDTIGQLKESEKIIRSGVERSVAIVNSLMTFAYAGEPKLVSYKIVDIIENTLLFIRNKIPKDVDIVKDFKFNKNVDVYPDKLHQVFLNIIDNAAYALHQTKLNPKILKIETDLNDNHIQIKIDNTGEPIPVEIMNKIFDPFFTTKDPGKGTGLGLSICYNLIKEHKGTIQAKNEANGVSFLIRLPYN